MKTLQEIMEGEENDPKETERLRLAWGKRHQDKGAFNTGRAGDHLLIPFECDLCIFRKLKKMNPLLDSTRDNLLLACIRRVNLDAMWSRTTNTVVGNRDRIRLGLRLSDQVGLEGPYEHFGPLPFKDHCGYEVAIQMVLHSRQPG